MGGQTDPPPSISWFSSTPAGIGLNKNAHENCLRISENHKIGKSAKSQIRKCKSRSINCELNVLKT